jgi:type IV pilus assembly protein PilV
MKMQINNSHTTMIKQQGISLIEVLVALLIVSIGLLGLASLQANSLKFNRSAYDRSQATQLAYDITDRMRANRTAALAGNYNLAMTDTHTATGTIAQQDLTAWIADITTRLPNGSGAITRAAGTDRFTISIQWSDDLTQDIDPDGDGDITGEAGTMVFAFETEF